MAAVTDRMNSILQRMEGPMIDDFHYLHQHPELSFEEYRTTEFIKRRLGEWGIEVLDLGLETGVVGLLNRDVEGPCVALRADIDALPIQEMVDGPYKSQVDGVMHACGHDSHTAALLGAARVLSEMKEDIRGSVKFLFQPAEEQNKGAGKMIRHGAMENPKVDAVFGIHNQPSIPTGQVGVKPGGLMSAVGRFYINVYGKGGHGGVPHQAVDPVVASAAVINALQSIVSRGVDPKDICVLSVCSLHAGQGMTYNIIPDKVEMVGTVRCYDPELGAGMEERMRRIVEHTAEAYGCTGELEYHHDLPAVINPDRMVPIALASVADVETTRYRATSMEPIPSTGGEDFTFFQQEAPGFFYWLGSGNGEKGCVAPWHSPHFRADEDAVPLGAGLYASSVLHAIEALREGTL